MKQPKIQKGDTSMKINFEQPSTSANDQPATPEVQEAKDRDDLQTMLEKAEQTENTAEKTEKPDEAGEERDTQGSYCGSGHGCMGSHYCASY